MSKTLPVQLVHISVKNRIVVSEPAGFKPPKICDHNKRGRLCIGKHVYEDVKIEELVGNKKLGSGEFGEVTQRIYKHRIVAVKEIPKAKRTKMEDYVMAKNDAFHIVQFYGIIETEKADYIIMEAMAASLTSLYRHLKDHGKFFPESVLGKIAVSTVDGLKDLYNFQYVVHRDVKPSNILIDWAGNVKLCDLGVCGKLKEDEPFARSSAGSPAYKAPEMNETFKSYDERVDIWSVGVTLYELITMEIPTFCSIGDKGNYIYQKSPKLPPYSGERRISEGLRKFVEACLTPNFEKRPKYVQLMAMEWFKYHKIADAQVGEWLAGNVKGKIEPFDN